MTLSVSKLSTLVGVLFVLLVPSLVVAEFVCVLPVVFILERLRVVTLYLEIGIV